METPTLPMDEHWDDPDHLELADQAWDQIELIVSQLALKTTCSNRAIRDLLFKVSCSWLDPADEISREIGLFKRRKNQNGLV